MAAKVKVKTNDAMTKLKRNEYIPFIGVGEDPTTHATIWARVDYSTIFELTINEQEESMDYICFENAVTEIKSNQPELPQEIATYEGNALHDWMAEHFFSLPTGAQCKVPFMMCFGGTDQKAWLCEATITSKVLNTVDGKYTFSIKPGGDIQKGTWSISSQTGQPTFTPDSANKQADKDKE